MDYNGISPKYIMSLINIIDKTIWDQYTSYEEVNFYIQRWHEQDENNWNWENFIIKYKDSSNTKIDLKATLHQISSDIIIKIAIDLGIDTPGFLPAIPKFKNVLKDHNQSAYQNFDRAIKNSYEHPDIAVALASSTLEGLIKTILSSDTFADKADAIKNKSLSKLVSAIIKEFGFDDKTKCPQEIITLASQLRSIGGTIDNLRSDKTTAHGKTADEYIVDDPLWASFVVNTSATVGLFLWEYFEKKYKPNIKKTQTIDDTPINMDDIPF